MTEGDQAMGAADDASAGESLGDSDNRLGELRAPMTDNRMGLQGGFVFRGA